jgi:hypothetical protein
VALFLCSFFDMVMLTLLASRGMEGWCLRGVKNNEYALVAQLVEHITDTDGVPGSNPGRRTREENSKMFRATVRKPVTISLKEHTQVCSFIFISGVTSRLFIGT